MLLLRRAPGQFQIGAYAVVFFEPQGRATKVFRYQPLQKEQHVRAVFESEVRAYEIASKAIELQTLIPRYFGIVKVTDILDEQNQSIAYQFIPNLAYQMGFRAG